MAEYHLNLAASAGNLGPIQDYVREYNEQAGRLGFPLERGEFEAVLVMMMEGIIRTELLVAAFIVSAPLEVGETYGHRLSEVVKRSRAAVAHLSVVESGLEAMGGVWRGM